VYGHIYPGHTADSLEQTWINASIKKSAANISAILKSNSLMIVIHNEIPSYIENLDQEIKKNNISNPNNVSLKCLYNEVVITSETNLNKKKDQAMLNF